MLFRFHNANNSQPADNKLIDISGATGREPEVISSDDDRSLLKKQKFRPTGSQWENYIKHSRITNLAWQVTNYYITASFLRDIMKLYDSTSWIVMRILSVYKFELPKNPWTNAKWDLVIFRCCAKFLCFREIANCDENLKK